MNLEKLYRINDQFMALNAAQRARAERHRERVTRSRELLSQALAHAHPDYLHIGLADLLAMPVEALAEADIDRACLERAAIEQRAADRIQQEGAQEAALCHAQGSLVHCLCQFAGVASL